MSDTYPVVRAIGVSHTACKYEFRRNLRYHSWSVFLFLFFIFLLYTSFVPNFLVLIEISDHYMLIEGIVEEIKWKSQTTSQENPKS